MTGASSEAPADIREVKGSSPKYMMAKLGSDKLELVRLRVHAKIMPGRGKSKMGYPGSKKSIASSQKNGIFQRPNREIGN